MANKHIRYGNYVVHIVYTHSRGTHAHGHTLSHTHNHVGLKLKCSREVREAVPTGVSKISLLYKTLNAGCK